MDDLGLIADRRSPNDPTFSLKNRLARALWQSTWLIAARWTPPQLHKWRVLLLRLFGARAAPTAHVYSSVKIWAPWNLEIRPFGSLGPDVICYNIAQVSIGHNAIVSQGAHLCTGTHDYRNPEFPLKARPIQVGARAWVCAGAFVGPGVRIGEGAVLAAAAVTFRDLLEWTVYVGNVAEPKGPRPRFKDDLTTQEH